MRKIAKSQIRKDNRAASPWLYLSRATLPCGAGGAGCVGAAAAQGNAALTRYLLGVTDDERQARREEIWGTTAAHFKHFAEVLEAARGPGAAVAAVTSADAAEAAAKERPALAFKITSALEEGAGLVGGMLTQPWQLQRAPRRIVCNGGILGICLCLAQPA